MIKVTIETLIKKNYYYYLTQYIYFIKDLKKNIYISWYIYNKNKSTSAKIHTTYK